MKGAITRPRKGDTYFPKLVCDVHVWPLVFLRHIMSKLLYAQTFPFLILHKGERPVSVLEFLNCLRILFRKLLASYFLNKIYVK